MTLAGIMAKWDRAHAHLEALQHEIAVFFDGDPYSFGEYLDCEAGEYGLRIEMNTPLPLAWSVIVGDYIHNLRSALDHLAWQLVLVSGGKPSERTQFPIFMAEPTGRAIGRWDQMVAGMVEPVVAQIRDVQPYAAGDQAKQHTLAILNALSNIDKHRLPLARVAAIAAHEPGTLGLLPKRDVEILDAQIKIGVPLEDGDEIAWATVRCTGPNPEIDTQGPVPMNVAFTAGSYDVPMQGLVEVGQYTQKLVTLFVALCSEQGLLGD